MNSLIAPIICFIILIYCYLRFSKGNDIKLEFSTNPPNSLDSLEIAFLLRGFITDNDIVSLLLSLANSGYISFNGNKDYFTIKKEKEYKENNLVKKILMKQLFIEKEEIELKDIKYKFNTTMYEIKKLINDKNNQRMIFETKLKKYKILVVILTMISIYSVNLTGLNLRFNSSFWTIFITVLMNIIALFIIRKDTEVNDRRFLGIVLLGIDIYLNNGLFKSFDIDTIKYIIGIVLITINIIMYIKLPDRTKYGNEYLGKIIGFKLKLEQMDLNDIKNKEEYFYQMLPYAYVLGIFDKWTNKAKNKINNYPNWHQEKEEFDILQFKRFIQNLLFKTMQTMLKEKSFTLVTYQKPNRIKEMYED